ncbi:MAG: FG-GAP repeat domain-containing protein [Akkermansiaceae bacterium]
MYFRNLALTLSFFTIVLSSKHTTAAEQELAKEPEIIDAPGLGDKEFVGPLAEVFDRLAPQDDGWDTEAFSEAASAQLYKLGNLLKSPHADDSAFLNLVNTTFSSTLLVPNQKDLTLIEQNEFKVRSWKRSTNLPASLSLPEAYHLFRSSFNSAEKLKLKTKLYKVQPMQDGSTLTNVLVEAAGKSSSVGRRQVNAEWVCTWLLKDGKPSLTNIELLSYQDVTRPLGEGKALFSDQTRTALGQNVSLDKQLLHSTDHWRARIPKNLGLDVVANVGFILADLNGDDLEDLYFCQQGGLPNLLFLRKSDGTFHDASVGSGVDWLDFSPSALAIDLDQDGDRDLVVALQFELLLMRNDGNAKFELAARFPLLAQTFSISAADYDLDGDLDLFACGYNPTQEDLEESGALGAPTPFHDANNGGKNTLLKNVGSFEFRDVTKESGLEGQNNTRFSFAAAWEDYDRDGDPDLYVANDYGRNNLYRNDLGKFVDVAGELDVEDMSSGMSVSWGDLNRDGHTDLYVSNMFSSAGNRITFQKQFQNGNAGDALTGFQRFARGNSLFLSTPDGGFKDVSMEYGATMARWAWGSRLVDLNNDGWEDILAANGFITTPDTGDL